MIKYKEIKVIIASNEIRSQKLKQSPQTESSLKIDINFCIAFPCTLNVNTDGAVGGCRISETYASC